MKTTKILSTKEIFTAFKNPPAKRTDAEKKYIQKNFSCFGCEDNTDCTECVVFTNQMNLENIQELINEGRE